MYNCTLKISVHKSASYASQATDFSLSCTETHTTASTDTHCADAVNPSDEYDAYLWTLTIMPLLFL